MQFPRIHLNGSAPSNLADQYITAHNAVDDAIRALEAIDCNARDYYPIGPDAFIVARKEHVARVAALAQVKADMEAIVLNIQEQDRR